MNEREQKTADKKQVKPNPTPAATLDPTGGQVDAGGLPGDLIAANGTSSAPTYASQLGNPHFQTAQKQAMAAKIGQVGSNRYLQQVMSQVQQSGTPSGPQPAVSPEQAPAKDEQAAQSPQPAPTEDKKAAQAPGREESEAQKPTADEAPGGLQAPAQAAENQARTGAAARVESSAPQAQGPVAQQSADPIGEQLKSLMGLPPTERIAAAAQTGRSIPGLLAQEQQAILETFPGALKTPMGIPTLKEATGLQEPPHQEATRNPLAAPEMAEVQPAPEQPADPKSAGLAFLAESQATAEALDRDEKAQVPDQAQTRRHTNTSAGPRPKADMTGPTDPALIEQKQAISGQQVGDLAAQAAQAIQKDYGETAIYPPEPAREQPATAERAEEPVAAPEAKEPASWGAVAAETAAQSQVQSLLAQRREQYQGTLQKAQQSMDRLTQQQQALAGRQEEAGALGGQMRQTVAVAQDQQLQNRGRQWLGQGGTVNAEMADQQEQLAAAQAQTQSAIAETQVRQAALPDVAEMGARMAESPQLQEAANAETMPDFEAQTNQMMAQHQEQRAARQAEVDAKWTEAQTIITQHEERQRANLTDIQMRAQQDVAGIKEEAQAQNGVIIGEYQTQTEQTRQQGEQTIAETVAQGEQEADQVLTTAEGEAGQTKAAGESDAASAISAGQARADAIMNSVPPMKEGEGAEAEHAQAEAEAKEKAEREMSEAEKEAQALLDQMETDVQAILDDATLTAAEKVQQVNDIVEQTITDVNAIMETKRTGATSAMEIIQAEIVCALIKNRLDEAVAEVSESLLEDEVVAARIEEIKDAIRDGTGNILIDASSLDDGSYPGPFIAAAFRQRMINCLDTLMTRPAGLEIIMQIMDDTETVTITADETSLASAARTNDALERDDGTAGPGCNTTINIHPDLDDDDLVLFDSNGNDIPAPLWLILGHELIHAAHNSAGRNVRSDESGTTRPPVTSPDYGNLEEEQTITTGDLTENDLREQFDIAGPRHGHGGRVVDDPTAP